MKTEEATRHLDAYAESVRNVDNMLGMLDAFGVDEDHGTHQFEGTPLEDLNQDIENATDFFHHWVNYDCLEVKVNAEMSLAAWSSSRYDRSALPEMEPVNVEFLIAFGGPTVRLTVPVHAQLPAKRPICELRLDWWSESDTVSIELPHLQDHVAQLIEGY